MCSRVRCGSCGKATWSGCGEHVEQALAGVPESERCRCGEPTGAGTSDTDRAGGLADPIPGAG